MIELHWLLLLFIIMISGSAGYMCCALMVMAKSGDNAMRTHTLNQDVVELTEELNHRTREVERLTNDLMNAGVIERKY